MMKRDIAKLAAGEYDLVIVGAGIYGACAAWDAALRGLRVALIDRGDFGGATSQNSQKTIHGGLRYLQKADIKRMRESIRERRTLMRIAPHLVHPFPCVMPTYGHLTKGREALTVAMLANDLVGFDRNRLDDPQKRIPRGRTVSRRKVLELLPGIPAKGLTGGAVWHDCQAYSTERLLLSFVLGACEKGAVAANYVEAVGFLTEGRRVTGVKARDGRTGREFDIRAKVVLNAAGPWSDEVLKLLDPRAATPPLSLSTALVVVTRPFIRGCGAGIGTRPGPKGTAPRLLKGSRLWFVTPWRDVSLVGTVHAPYTGDPDGHRVTEGEIAALLEAINAAYPPAKLGPGDVRCFYGGILPMKRLNRKTGEAVLLTHYRLIDHRRRHGWDGLVTMVGVKYTTARDVAEKAVDLVVRKLRLPQCRSMTGATPVPGGNIGMFDAFLGETVRTRPPWLGEESARHLVHHYGARSSDILALAAENPALAKPLPCQAAVIGAEIVHAARDEMALTLADTVLRRTGLGASGRPPDECLLSCAELMGRELGWHSVRTQDEIDSVKALYVPARGEA